MVAVMSPAYLILAAALMVAGIRHLNRKYPEVIYTYRTDCCPACTRRAEGRKP